MVQKDCILGNFARRELQNSESFCEASWSRLRIQGTAIVGLSENRENQSSLYAVFLYHTLTKGTLDTVD